MSKSVLLAIMTGIIVVQAYPAFALDPLDRTDVENPRLVNAFGSSVGNKISVNQQVQIMSDVKNNQDHNQEFIYIVQIKDASQRVISLGWFSGNLNANQVFSPALSWTPQSSGDYSAEIFVWDGFVMQLPLAESTVIQITVS